MPSPFPCSPVICECSWNKNPRWKKKDIFKDSIGIIRLGFLLFLDSLITLAHPFRYNAKISVWERLYFCHFCQMYILLSISFLNYFGMIYIGHT